MYEAVIFDWDGTLADSRKAVLASFHGALKEVLGTDVKDEFIERRIGIGAAWTFREILAAKGLEDEKIVRRLVEAKVRHAIKSSKEVWLFPGAKELLESLFGKTKMGLASMNNRPVIDRLLKVLEVARFFDTVITVDEVSKSKPDPEIFLKTAEHMHVIPTNCVVLEDSIFGVKAAKAAKMGCIAVTQGAYSAEELASANADLIVSSLKERNAILKFILANN